MRIADNFAQKILKFFQTNMCVLFVMLILGMTLSICCSFEMNWDFANYHYYNAFAFMHHRLNFDIVPASVNTFFNPLIEMPLYFAITHLNEFPKLIYALQGMSFGLMMFALYKIFSLFFTPDKLTNVCLILLAVIISVSGQATFIQIGTSTNEISIAFLILSGLYILLKIIKFPKLQVWYKFLIAGLMMGVALGLKPTCITWCMASGLMLMFCFKYLQKPLQSIVLFALGGLMGYLIINGWWMLVLWRLYQNPFFPFLNGIFKSEYFDAFNYRDARFLPTNFLTALIYPFQLYFSHESRGNDYRLTIYYILLWSFPLYLMVKSRFKWWLKNRPMETAFFVFMLLGYILWLNIFSIYRYSVVYECLGSVMLLAVLKHFLPRRLVFRVIYASFVIVFLYALIGQSFKFLQSYKIDKFIFVEPIRLPENTLVKLYNFPTAAVIPELYKNNPTLRAAGYSQWNIKYMKGSDFAERGKFRGIRDQIEKEYKNKIIVYYNSDIFPTSLEVYDKNLDACYKMAEHIFQTEHRVINCLDDGNFHIIREALREEMKDDYYCRLLKNNIYPTRWHICVPKELKTQILGDTDD